MIVKKMNQIMIAVMQGTPMDEVCEDDEQRDLYEQLKLMYDHPDHKELGFDMAQE